LLIDRVGRPRPVVEPEKADVGAALGERRQQRQQVPFRAADSSDPVDVQNPHVRCVRARRSQSQTSAVPASNAIRKSHATRYRVAPTNTVAANVSYASRTKTSVANQRGTRSSPTRPRANSTPALSGSTQSRAASMREPLPGRDTVFVVR